MYLAFVMKPMGDVHWIRSFDTEDEVDTFSRWQSSDRALDPLYSHPDLWEKYDPPVVIVFEANDPDAMGNGKYERPLAVYQRGQRYDCQRLEND